MLGHLVFRTPEAVARSKTAWAQATNFLLRFVSISLGVVLLAVAVAGCTVQPKALDDLELRKHAVDRATRLFAHTEPVKGPISQYEAIARALKYNLDHEIEIRAQALRQREFDISTYQLLPNLVASSGYTHRDRYLASRSVGIDQATGLPNGIQVLSFNTSQARDARSADLGFSWHVLDFGLSYVRAQQSGDRALIAEESRRKVSNRIVEDVRTAYWRAATAERLMRRLQRLQGRIRTALVTSKAMSIERQTSIVNALSYRRDLLDLSKRIDDLTRELATAKLQLAALMNLPPNAEYQLQPLADRSLEIDVPDSLDVLLDAAFMNRSELREITYQQRINRREADVALLELLPGLQLTAAGNSDDNKLLLHGEWLNWGAKIAWNLVRLAQYPAKRRVIEAEKDLLDTRALALTLAVMTQVHVARTRLVLNQRRLKGAREHFDVQNRLLQNMRVEFGAGRISEQALIREEMNSLVAEINRDLAHSELQNSYANVYASIGSYPSGTGLDLTADIATIADRIRKDWVPRWKTTPRRLASVTN